MLRTLRRICLLTPRSCFAERRYHSHPGYGCWMSGIDCSTQMLNQQYTEPFLAIVIDPVRTCAAGKVEIGAFRTYPQGYKPPDESQSKYQTIPLNKIEDFGVHANQYYSLDVSFSSLISTLMYLMCCGTSIGLILSPRHLYRRTGTSSRVKSPTWPKSWKTSRRSQAKLDGLEVC